MMALSSPATTSDEESGGIWGNGDVLQHGVSPQRWYNFPIAERGWKWPKDTSRRNTSHGLSSHAGGMKTTLLTTSHYLQDWKAGAKSCQVQQSEYTLGIHGAAPMTEPVRASPYATPPKGTTRLVLTSVWPGSHCRVLICALLGCRNRWLIHTSQIFFSAFGNQNSQMAVLVLKDPSHACRKRETKMLAISDNSCSSGALFFCLDIFSRWV